MTCALLVRVSAYSSKNLFSSHIGHGLISHRRMVDLVKIFEGALHNVEFWHIRMCCLLVMIAYIAMPYLFSGDIFESGTSIV